MKLFFQKVSILSICSAAFLVSGHEAKAAVESWSLNFLDTLTTNDTANLDGGAILRAYTAGSGSGVFTDLFRIQASGTEGGYNYGGASAAPFNQSGGVGTLNVDLGQIPKIFTAGNYYLQVLTDLNEPNGKTANVTLTDFKVYVQSDSVSGNTTNTYVNTIAGLSSLGTLVYDLNATNTQVIDMIPNGGGSGTTDYEIDIPVSYFQGKGFKTTDNMYIWMQFSNADSGFEEVSYDGTLGATSNLFSTPEPATVWGGISMAGLLGFGFIRRRKNASGASDSLAALQPA